MSFILTEQGFSDVPHSCCSMKYRQARKRGKNSSPSLPLRPLNGSDCSSSEYLTYLFSIKDDKAPFSNLIIK